MKDDQGANVVQKHEKKRENKWKQDDWKMLKAMIKQFDYRQIAALKL